MALNCFSVRVSLPLPSISVQIRIAPLESLSSAALNPPKLLRFSTRCAHFVPVIYHFSSEGWMIRLDRHPKRNQHDEPLPSG